MVIKRVDGWVTVEGRVDWHYQKSLAESAVKDVWRQTAVEVSAAPLAWRFNESDCK